MNRKILEKLPHIKFRQNLFNGSRVVPHWKTDICTEGRNDANRDMFVTFRPDAPEIEHLPNTNFQAVTLKLDASVTNMQEVMSAM
jgi:hypothetical protein